MHTQRLDTGIPVYYMSSPTNIGSQLILYDFNKSFDMMDHTILISKLQAFQLPMALASSINLRNLSHFVTNKTSRLSNTERWSTSRDPVWTGFVTGFSLFVAIFKQPNHQLSDIILY